LGPEAEEAVVVEHSQFGQAAMPLEQEAEAQLR
jgi:hypothetical protein